MLFTNLHRRNVTFNFYFFSQTQCTKIKRERIIILTRCKNNGHEASKSHTIHETILVLIVVRCDTDRKIQHVKREIINWNSIGHGSNSIFHCEFEECRFTVTSISIDWNFWFFTCDFVIWFFNSIIDFRSSRILIRRMNYYRLSFFRRSFSWARENGFNLFERFIFRSRKRFTRIICTRHAVVQTVCFPRKTQTNI